MRINPLTGQPEFFLKKIFQRAKKAVRDIGSELKDNDLLRTAVSVGAPLLFPALGGFAARNLFGAGIGALSGQKPRDILKDLALQNVISGGLGSLNAGQGNRMTGFTEGVMGNPYQDFNTGETMGSVGSAGGGSNAIYDPLQGGYRDTVIQEASSPGIFNRIGETVTNFMVNPDETGLKKYSGLIATAGVGAAMLAAQQAGDQLAFGDYVYDPAQNVYLKGNQTIDQNSFYNALSDFYDSGGTAFGSETESPVGYAQGGDTKFPRKTGMIDGPGTGQSDSIPAMLSDGEFVITKQAVVGLGNGSRDKGTKKLYSFMDQMEDKAKGMGIGKL
jgi:hypothetical protein